MSERQRGHVAALRDLRQDVRTEKAYENDKTHFFQMGSFLGALCEWNCITMQFPKRIGALAVGLGKVVRTCSLTPAHRVWHSQTKFF
jgi:hypothetical protein